MTEPVQRPTPLQLERWLLGELDSAERARVEQALSPEEREALRAVDANDRAQLFARLSPAAFAEAVNARQSRAPARAAYLMLPIAACAAAALLLVRAPAAPEQHDATANVPGERSKGLSPRLHVYRRHQGEVERLHDDAPARAHDLVQLGYVSAGRPYGVLLSIDGQGTVTLHLPRTGEQAEPLTHSGEQLLPSAYELDAAPRYERFFFVTAPQPFAVARALDAAHELATDEKRAEHSPLSLPAGFEQHALRLRKEAP